MSILDALWFGAQAWVLPSFLMAALWVLFFAPAPDAEYGD